MPKLFTYLRYKTVPTLLRSKLEIFLQVAIPVAVCALAIAIFAPQIPGNEWDSSPRTAIDGVYGSVIEQQNSEGEPFEILRINQSPTIFYVTPEENSSGNRTVWASIMAAVFNRIYGNSTEAIEKHTRQFSSVSTMEDSFFLPGQLSPQCDLTIVLSEENDTLTYSVQSAALPMSFVDIAKNKQVPEAANPFSKSMQEQLLDSGVVTLQMWLLQEVVAELHDGLSVELERETTTFQPYSFTFTDDATSRQEKLKKARSSATLVVVPIFIALSLIQVFLRSGTNFVSDKEYMLRQQLVLNGMSRLSYVISAIIENLFIFTLSALASAGALSGVGLWYGTKYGVVLLFWIVAVLALTIQAFIAQSLFSNARFAPLLFFLFFAGQLTVGAVVSQCENSACTPGLQAFVGVIFPPANFLLTVSNSLYLENEDNGVSNKNFWTNRNEHSVSIGVLMTMQLVYVFFGYFFGCYLEEIIPGPSGVSRPLYYPILDLKNWITSSTKNKEGDDQNSNRNGQGRTSPNPLTPLTNACQMECCYSEAEASTAPVAVQALGLRKVFGDFVAVDDFNMELRVGEITALLGKNGAGKSTSISMMTGLLEADAGDVKYFGNSLLQNPDKCKSLFSVCPQHNVLIPKMTAREHLLLFGALKGMSSEELNKGVEDAVESLSLGEKADAFANDLSGGQKRRLMLLQAFIGNTPIVFIDECTAGVDPVARSEIHDLIRNNRESRCIILCTHFVTDEADELGDKIAIMHNGKLERSGTSLELKSSLGTGYSVVFQGVETRDHESLVARVQTICPDAAVGRAAPGELVLTVPFSSSNTISLLQMLETDSNLADKFSFQMTTLDDVFLKITDGDREDADASERLEDSSNSNVDHHDSHHPVDLHGVDESLLTTRPTDNCFTRYPKQILALHFKRAMVAKRDVTSFVFQVFFPLLFLVIGVSVYSSLSSSIEVDTSKEFWFQTNITGAPLDQSKQLIGFSSNITDQESIDQIQLLAPGSSTTGVVQCCLTNLSATFDPSTIAPSIAVWRAANWTPIDLTVNRREADASMDFYTNVTHQGAVLSLMNQFSEGAMNLAVSLKNTTTGTAPGSSSSNTTTSIKHFTGRFQAMPTNPVERRMWAQFMLVLCLSLSFSFVPASYAAFVVKERELNALFLQLASGMPRLLYWFSSILWDTGLTLIFCAITLLGLFLGLEKEMEGNYAIFFQALFAYTLCATLVTYSISLLYDRYAKAQVSIALGFWGLNFCLTIGFISVAGSQGPGSDATKIVAIVMSAIHPLFGVMHVVMLIVDLFGVGSAARANCPGAKNLGDPCITGDFMFILWVQTASAGFILLLHQLPYGSWFRGCCWRCMSGEPPALSKEDEERLARCPDDEDVVAERTAAEQLLTGDRFKPSSSPRPAVILSNVHKVYSSNKFHAVKGISATIPPGEIFGWAGANGAGKSSAVKMIAGETVATHGGIEVCGINAVANPSGVQDRIGLCPQFDALLPEMTCRETLLFYAMLKGLSLSDCGVVVDAFLRHCGLDQYRDRPSGKLSGGNRRRLSLAVAIIGAPDVLLVDEASSGACPSTRRKTWSVIQSAARLGSAVCLISHHLEEIESLASRACIMSRGRIRCIGTMPHLRQKYSQGFRLELSSAAGSQECAAAAQEWVLTTFEGAVSVEAHNHRMKFTLPNTLHLSEIFEKVLKKREEHPDIVVDFAVASTSLESIFFQIVSADEHPIDGDAAQLTVPEVIMPESPLSAGSSQRNRQGAVRFTPAEPVPDHDFTTTQNPLPGQPLSDSVPRAAHVVADSDVERP